MGDVKKIMMVDDDEDLLALVKMKLEETKKYAVVYTSKGDEAVGLAGEERPDLILLDIDMPEMDGPEVANALGGSEKTRDIPILFLSSLITKDDVGESGRTIAGHHMIPKSMDFKYLISEIDAVIG